MAMQPKNGKATNVFLGVDGKPTTTDAQIVESYREEAKISGGPIDLVPDDQLLETVRAIVGNERADTTIRDKRMEALQELQSTLEDEQETGAPSAMSDHLKDAADFGETIAETADTWMELGADSNETRIGAPLHLAVSLMKDNEDEWKVEFADNGFPIRCPGVLELPVPGSSSEDAEGTWGNNMLDVVKTKDGLERYYRTMSDTIGAGVQLLSDINDLKAMSAPGYALGSARNKALGTRYETDKEGRKSKLGQLNTRRNQRATVLSRAIGFCQTITRLNDEFDEEYFDWKFVESWEQFDDVCKRGKPLQLVSIGNKKKGVQGGDTDPFGLTQFIGLQHPSPINGQIRIERAKQLMGGKPALAAQKLRQVMTERKEADDASNQGGGRDALGKDIGIPTPEIMESVFNGLLTGADPSRGTEAELFLKKFRTFYNQVGPEADRRLKAMDDCITWMWENLRSPYKERLDTIEKNQNKRDAA